MTTETLQKPNAGFSFDVHDVTPSIEKLKTATGLETICALLGEGHPIEDCSGKLEPMVSYFNWDWVMPPPANALMGAIHLSFAKHLPLVLTPDVIWITIIQGAATMQREEDKANPNLGEKKILRPVIGQDYGPETRWEDVVEACAKAVIEDLSRRDLLKLSVAAGSYLCDFSTTGPRERLASCVALLNAYSVRYEVHPKCICGIPKVTLEGEVADWEKLRGKAEMVVKNDPWKEKLLPILDQFVKAAKGEQDRAFWKDIYKLEHSYGSQFANGWSTQLFPYLTLCGNQNGEKEQWHPKRISNSATVKNPMIYGRSKEYPEIEVLDYDAMREKLEIDPETGNRVDKYKKIQGVYCGHFPHGICSAEVVMTRATPQTVTVEVAAGLVGVKQEADSTIRPVAGWAVRKAREQRHDA